MLLNPRLDLLADYPFDRLRALLSDPAPAGLKPHVLSIGEPRHPPPSFINQIIGDDAADWGRYPPIDGTSSFRQAVAGWLARRFQLPPTVVDVDKAILPVAGTRESLYLIASVLASTRQDNQPAAVLMPNPFYQVYWGAAAMSGMEAICAPAIAETGFLPDLSAIDDQTWSRLAAFFLCSPANPQGACASLDYLCEAVSRARRHDFLLIVDECYADLYDTVPPVSALNACDALGGSLDRVVVFHSCSKRSSVPGLRSGFVAGDEQIIAAFRRLRSYGGASVPLPVIAASTALWNDDSHAEENRRLYRAKFDLAERLLANRVGFFRPAGGFFLWLDVGDGERAAQRLWREAAIRVLPGAYLAQKNKDGGNPGAAYIRVALVDDPDSTEDALSRLAKLI